MLLIRLRNVCLVLASRGLFVGHSMITIWKAATYLDNKYYWMLLFVDAVIIFEAMIVIVRNKKFGLTWLCTSAALYLLATVPALWFLKLNLLRQKVKHMHFNDGLATTSPKPFNETPPAKIGQFGAIAFQGGTNWTPALEQTLLLILILGRWIMPKGHMSRNALSQLLFVYLAIASDIMGLFVLFVERSVIMFKTMHYVILIGYSASLFQLAITSGSSPKPLQQFIFDPDNPDQLVPTVPENVRGWRNHPEVISLISTLALMDGPFFIIRFYVVFALHTINYNILFFIGKNLMMILLTVYRMVIIRVVVAEERKLHDEQLKLQLERQEQLERLLEQGGSAYGAPSTRSSMFGVPPIGNASDMITSPSATPSGIINAPASPSGIIAPASPSGVFAPDSPSGAFAPDSPSGVFTPAPGAASRQSLIQ